MRTRCTTRFLAVSGPLVAGLLIAGCGQPRSGAPLPAGPPEVGVVTIHPQRVAVTTELPGRTSAYLVAEVRPQVSGIVQERLFTEGSDVEAGEVLYRIDAASYQAACDSAQAALAKAQAARASAQAARSRAEANAVPRRLKAERFAELAAINAVSRQDADDAAAALKQADTEVQSAAAAIQSAEAEIAGAEAALAAAQINLARTRVTAPISGRIGVSAVTTGALVTASQPAPLATIQQLNRVYVDVSESSANLLRLRQNLASGRLTRGGAGQAAVRLVLENGAPYPIEGSLKFSDITVQPGTGSVTLRTVFPNPDQVLLPGMFVRAIVQEGESENGVLVPQRGVSRNQKGEPVVMVVGADEKVEVRLLKVDRAIGDAWLVAEGLAAGDRVILEGLQRIRPGVAVKAVPFGSTATAPATGAPQSAAAGK
jgi:membrane fusion protein (multidrug efflux system)